MRCGPEKDHVNLQTPSSSLEQSQTRPPGTSETTWPLAGADATCEPIPSPYLTIDPEGKDKILPGLYAAGEIDLFAPKLLLKIQSLEMLLERSLRLQDKHILYFFQNAFP